MNFGFKHNISPETKSIAGLQVEITRKEIKNLYLRVNSITKTIRISAPKRMNSSEIDKFVVSRIEWIHKQLQKELPNISVKPPEYVTGEFHSLFGKSYRLKVLTGSSRNKVVLVEPDIIQLFIKGSSTPDKRKKILEDWYRIHLKHEIPMLIEKWEPIMGVKVREFGVKRMKTRWGTCNIRAQRLWLNLELAKYPYECLEYVVVHEMVHLLERLHSKRFYALMSRFLPEWKRIKAKLNGKVD